MKATNRPISSADLSHSKIHCYRIEDEIWRRLDRAGCTQSSPVAVVARLLHTISKEPPAWCEMDAWLSIIDSFVRWARSFGSLRVFMDLRRKKVSDPNIYADPSIDAL